VSEDSISSLTTCTSTTRSSGCLFHDDSWLHVLAVLRAAEGAHFDRGSTTVATVELDNSTAKSMSMRFHFRHRVNRLCFCFTYFGHLWLVLGGEPGKSLNQGEKFSADFVNE
jgi:hypothetical protein